MGKTLNKLNEFQKKFCAEYISGEFAGNGTQSYLKVYETKTPGYANLGAVNLLKKPHIQAELQRLREGAGLSDDFIYARIREGLDAKFITSFRGRAAETELPDHSTRHKYLETAAKLLDMFPSQKIDQRSVNIDIQIEKLPPAELANLLKGMAKKLNVKSKRKTNLLGIVQNQDGV